jgi:uncharacterized protein (DUF433 family)
MATLAKFVPGKITMDPKEVRYDASRLAGTWVQGTEDVCGGATRIRSTRFTVWGLVEWRNLGLSDAEILQRHPDLSQADLNAAWAYYERHREEVDQAIRDNQEA